VVKFGLDERDSMLTKENFHDTWGRLRRMPATGEEMVVDKPMDGTNGMQVEDDRHKSGGRHHRRRWNVWGRNQRREPGSLMVPVFAFQRRGIWIKNHEFNRRGRNYFPGQREKKEGNDVELEMT